MSTRDHYKADLRELRFLLYEQFKVEELSKFPTYAEFSKDMAETVLEECHKFSLEMLAPCWASADREGCSFKDGKVGAPAGFKAAWEAIYEAGWVLLPISEEHGGMGAPIMFSVVCNEMLSGANTAFYMYPGLSLGVAEVIEAFGSEDVEKRFLSAIYEGRVSATMCLTEPQAGSDVGLSTSMAVPQDNGEYLLTGTKIFISCGDHDITRNIIHLVLARTPDAPEGTSGLSLFLVPKYWVDADGNDGEFNNVHVGNVEHKMGIAGSSTCLMNFGDEGGSRALLVGKLNKGMRQMFMLMNIARIYTGVQAIASASTAYLNALDYSRSRKQGSAIDKWKDASAPRVAIIEHADVRRMLLEMKSRVEAMRSLVVKASKHWDLARCHKESDPDKSAYNQGQLELFTPVVKAWCSDQGFRVCELAIQTLGGYGYVSDYPVEQYMRDSKVFSIYEGTNFIQSIDLVGRKIAMRSGQNLMDFSADVAKFCAANEGHERLGDEVRELEIASNKLTGASMTLLGFSKKDLGLVSLYATRYLEIMAEVAGAWQLLEGAVIACAALENLDSGHPDQAFYQGRIASAVFFANNILPGVSVKCDVLAKGDRIALDVEESWFSSSW